jgi:uncharacterized membrane protein
MPGRTPDEVVPLLAATFKLSDETARDLILGGSGQVLKQGLTGEEAQRYRSALGGVGLRVTVEPALATPQNGSETEAAAVPRSSPTFLNTSSDADAVLKVGERLSSVPSRSGKSPDYRPDSPRSRPAGNGWLWINEAWALFKRQPGAWVGALIVFYLIIIVLSMVPLVGGVAVTILSPILSAGLMIGAHKQHRFGRFEIGHLFAGVSRYPVPLALLGLVYLLIAIAIVVTTGLIVVGVLASLADPFVAWAIHPNDLDLFPATPLLLLPVLGATLLFVPLAMAMFFAPSLIALDQIRVLDACRLSFLGCLKNIPPFSIFGLSAMVMVVVGSVPLLLGLLIVFPVLTIAVYTAYRDIFYSAGRCGSASLTKPLETMSEEISRD